jgi:hypothetical protein
MIPAKANNPNKPSNKGLQHVLTSFAGGITGGGTILLS